MFKVVLPAALVALSFSSYSFADDPTSESKSSVKIEDVNPESKNKVAGDIDEEISNAKLRAESGSKSKFSLSLTSNYTGGAVNNAFGTERPNLSGLPGQQVLTSIGGGFEGRYRLDKNDSFTLGTTYAVMTPFQGDVNKGTDQMNLFDPNVSYNHVAKLGGFQTVATVAYAYGTSNESKDIDLTHQGTLQYNAMYEFKNHVSVGAALQTDYNYYITGPGGNASTAAPGKYGGDKRVAWDLGLFPVAEYQITDRYSVRTVFGYFNWKHLYGDSNQSRLLHTYSYQSVGIGIAVTRDVFLYPAIQFLPDHIAADRTNVALAATINVF